MWWRLQHTTFGAAKGYWSDQSCELCTAQGMPEGNEKAHSFRTLAKGGLQRGEAEFSLAKQLWFWFCCSFGLATWDTTQKHNSSVWSLASEQEICCRTLMSLSAAVPIRVKTGGIERTFKDRPHANLLIPHWTVSSSFPWFSGFRASLCDSWSLWSHNIKQGFLREPVRFSTGFWKLIIEMQGGNSADEPKCLANQ